MRLAVIGLAIAAFAFGFTAKPASAFGVCDAFGFVSGAAGRVCEVVTHAKTLIRAGKKLAGGHIVGALKTAVGVGTGGGGGGTTTSSTASTALGLAAIGVWVAGGAKVALDETAKALGATTSPQLESTWFSSVYWRMAGIGALLTLPFLFAAAIQALLHADLSLLLRAAFGYLPLALLTVSIAAPVTMLLLAGSDYMSGLVSAAAGNAGAKFLGDTGLKIGLLTILTGSPFLAFLVSLLIAGGALVLWLELLMREAAVYVIVLMLPLVFAALVWPARRVWAVRAIELLIALILSKFAMVSVLALGGAALGNSSGHSVTSLLAGLVLVLMGAFAPWALLRLVPIAEIASGAAGSLRSEARAIHGPLERSRLGAEWAHYQADAFESGVTADMRRAAQQLASGPASSSDAEGADAERDRLSGLAAGGQGVGSGVATEESRVPGAGDPDAGAGAGEAGTGGPLGSADGDGTHAGPRASDGTTEGTGAPDPGPEHAATPDAGAQRAGEGSPASSSGAGTAVAASSGDAGGRRSGVGEPGEAAPSNGAATSGHASGQPGDAGSSTGGAPWGYEATSPTDPTDPPGTPPQMWPEGEVLLGAEDWESMPAIWPPPGEGGGLTGGAPARSDGTAPGHSGGAPPGHSGGAAPGHSGSVASGQQDAGPGQPGSAGPGHPVGAASGELHDAGAEPALPPTQEPEDGRL